MTIWRAQHVRAALLAWSLAILPPISNPSLAGDTIGKKPNVIIILTDDQGYGDLSCHGNPVLKTPHLDRLYHESIRLTDFHVAPMCTPTRAQLLTGRDALKTGAMNVSSGRTLLRKDIPTMADIFAASGYRTGLFGKWHLGDNYPYRPNDRGFQEAVWFPSSHIGSAPDFWNNDYFNDHYRHNHEIKRFDGYCTDVFFSEAIRWIRQCHASNEPFFAYLALNVPHWPHFVPDQYRQPYRAQPHALASFFGMIANIDENLGRLEDMLSETGLRDDTILFFMTDNGGTVGVRLFNAGMRGQKVQLLEGGHRVPCFIRWPIGPLRRPTDIPQLTQCQDILPTLLELCGLKSPDNASFDGVSLAGILCGDEENLPDRMIVIQFSRMDVGRPQKGDAAILWRRWRLLNNSELYDVQEDLAQKNNLFHEQPDVVREMRAHYEQWWQQVEPDLDTFHAIHLGSDKENPLTLSACEWADVFLDQGVQVRRGERKNGVWHVHVERGGEYEFALRRWPAGTDATLRAAVPIHRGEDGEYPAGVALPIGRARLRVGQQELSKPVSADDREAVFTVDLAAGTTQLQTWFLDEAGTELCGAYFVRVQRN